MKKKIFIFLFLGIFILGFVIGYLTMSWDIKDGFFGAPDQRSIWQILLPF